MKTVLLICLMSLPLVAFGQSVVQVEYFLDVDAGFGKNTLRSVTPSPDGLFSFTVDVSAAPAGYHVLYMRTRDSNGQWSHTTMRNVEVIKNQAAGNIARVDYFFDTDPGVGKAVSVALTDPQPNGTFTFVIPKDKTTLGTHTMYVRAQASPEQDWSLTQWKAVTIVNCTPPDQPVAVSSQTVCSGSLVTFTVPNVSQATSYRWSGPASWTVVSGQGTNTVTLNAPTVTATTTFTALSVAAVNGCDAGPARSFSATVNPLPAAPVITSAGAGLTSSAASGNQWSLNGTPINGATGQTYQPLAAGNYTVQVTVNSCTSLSSSIYTFIVTAVDDPTRPDVEVFPNPVSTFFTLKNLGTHPAQIRLYSITGQLVLTSGPLIGTQQVNLEQVATGCYILQINQNDTIRRQLLMKL